jgi:hypothetical protein
MHVAVMDDDERDADGAADARGERNMFTRAHANTTSASHLRQTGSFGERKGLTAPCGAATCLAAR